MSEISRVAIVGATGILGTEILEILNESDLKVKEIIPIATDRSLGEEIVFRGRSLPIETELADLRDIDLVLLCAPSECSLDWVRKSLKAKVPCMDLSGSVSDNQDVPLLVAGEASPLDSIDQPILACPGGSALACFLALAPLAGEFGPLRVTLTCLEPVSNAGRTGIQTLQDEVLAVFSQEEMLEPHIFSNHIAFNCIPFRDGESNPGPSISESRFSQALGRLLGPGSFIDSTLIHVPTFSGMGASIAVETESSLTAEQATAIFEQSSEIKLWDSKHSEGPTTRDSASAGRVLIGRIRPYGREGTGLQFWLTADSLYLSAVNAVRLVEGRFATS